MPPNRLKLSPTLTTPESRPIPGFSSPSGRAAEEIGLRVPERREYDLAFEIPLATALVVLTVGLCGLVGWELGDQFARLVALEKNIAAAGQGIFIAIVGMLIYGSLVYQLTRLGYLRRIASHRRAAREDLEQVYLRDAPGLAVLVPSYKEEPEVVRRTLLSAALQDYPNRRVVLLIDDPANPITVEDARALKTMRTLPEQLQALFDAAAGDFEQERNEYLLRRSRETMDPVREARQLSRLYDRAAEWLAARSTRLDRGDPGENLIAEHVLFDLIRQHRARANEIRALARRGSLDRTRVDREYHRLACLFRVRFSSFQRKRYLNLSHEPNKAMNLNTFIGLMGGAFREQRRAGGVHLERCDPKDGQFSFDDADYIITLDADSILLPDYALRLIHELERPGNERVAVIQTPYSSIPAETGSLEHIAGATTDIQYIIHQGFSAYRATYWVGANALLRKRALHDIAEHDTERGFAITRYIQDRTVIEDTESSIDLICKGWQLQNYPERLAYSATPPDFGSLLIQRRRWANGGLIILPKLLRYLVRNPGSLNRLREGFFRLHYLVSIAAVNIGLMVIFAFPFEESLRSVWLPLSTLPYFFVYARDLSHIGYRASDLFRVYALNLLLIPVNLGGVFKSLQQAVTRAKIPFGRTPKVKGRTVAPVLYIAAEFGILAWWIVGAARDFTAGYYAHVVFALLNAAFLAYAIERYLGFAEGWQDLRDGLGARFPALMVPLLRQI